MFQPDRRVEPDQNCDWCNLSGSIRSIPDAFCWTRMQTESGQSLKSILCRKELERVLGDGVFYWGIGTSMKASMKELLLHTSKPEVLFSVMRTKPKSVDVSPGAVLIWTEFIDEAGNTQPLPEFSLVLSRADTASGAMKRCYALVCYSDTNLTPSFHAALDFSHFRNLGGSRGRIGFSQVTAIVKHIPSDLRGIRYDVSLRALLVKPYFITLGGSKRLSDSDRLEIDAVTAKKPTPDQWKAFVKQLRTRYYGECSPAKLLRSPFG